MRDGEIGHVKFPDLVDHSRLDREIGKTNRRSAHLRRRIRKFAREALGMGTFHRTAATRTEGETWPMQAGGKNNVKGRGLCLTKSVHQNKCCATCKGRGGDCKRGEYW